MTHFCDRHQDGKVKLEIPTAGSPFIFDPISHHRPRGYYESIQCLSCRLEEQNYDDHHAYFCLIEKQTKNQQTKNPLTPEQRLKQTKNRLRRKIEQKK